MWSVGRIVGGGLLGVTALTAGGGGVYAYKDEGLRRSIVFWGQAFPIFVHYKFVEWRLKNSPQEERNARFEQLHNKYAPTVYNLTLKLRGFFLKCAQIVSVRSEMVPTQYLTFLRTLQDNVPPEYTQTEVRAMVERSLGKPLSEVFKHFDDTPIGAASIGQVHRATLKDGREVVVKLQFPKAEQYFRSDIKTLIDFCDLAMPYFVPSLREVEKQYKTEFDYTKEADNLQLVANNVNSVWRKKVVVPRPIKELCTRQVLVMEYLPGIKLVDGIRNQFTRIAASQGRTLEDLEDEQMQKIKSGVDESGPTKFQMKLFITFLKIQDFAVNTWRFTYNTLYGRWVSSPIPYLKTELPINIPEILDTLMKVHGYEIFVNGAFNGDPHPGNILLLDDGRLGLIDYGQVKHMTLDERIKLARLIVSLAENKEDEILRIFTKDLGTKTKKMRKDILLEYARFFYDYDTPESRHGHNVHNYLDYLGKQDPLMEVGEDYVVASRVSILLRGMGTAFHQHISIAKSWKPYAEQLLHQHKET